MQGNQGSQRFFRPTMGMRPPFSGNNMRRPQNGPQRALSWQPSSSIVQYEPYEEDDSTDNCQDQIVTSDNCQVLYTIADGTKMGKSYFLEVKFGKTRALGLVDTGS